MRVGACVIGPEHWTDYQLPALRAMAASVVKVQLHDADGNWGVPWFSAAFLNDLVSVVGADGTIIIRTPETRIAPETLRQLFTSALPHGTTSLRDWLTSLPSYGPGVVVEVGNEPDLAGLDAWDHRQRLVNTATALRGLLPRWVDLCASLATWRGRPGTDQAGDQYNRILLDVGQAQRPVLDCYDSLGVHGYGYHSLDRSEREAWAVYDLAAATGKLLWWTEVGIAARQPWPQKMAEYRRFAASLPGQVKGVTIFALSTAPEWTGDPCYGIDATDGVVDVGLPGCRVLSTPRTPATVPTAPPVASQVDPVSPPAGQEGTSMPTATEVTTRTIATLRERGLTVIDLRGQLPVNSNPAYRYGSVRGGLAGVQHLIQHWTGDSFGRATLQSITGTDYGEARISARMSQDDEVDLLRWYANYHISRDGGVWGGIAYGIMVLPSGRVYVNWDLGTLTYHAFNANATSYALCCPNANAQPLTAAQKLALAHVWEVLCQKTPEIPAGQGDLFGHREAAFLDSRNAGTVCPGSELLAAVQAYRTAGTLPAVPATAPDVQGQTGPTVPPSGMVFTETGKWVIEPFLSYFLGNGGVRMFGLPVSGMLTAQAADGQQRQMQYFERWVFEWHPENDAANQVLGQRLGAQAAKAAGLVGAGID